MLGEQGCMASRAGSFLQLSCVCGGGAAGGATVRTHVSSEGPEARPGVLRDSRQSCCCSDLQPSLDAGSVCRMDFDLHCLPPLSSPGVPGRAIAPSDEEEAGDPQRAALHPRALWAAATSRPESNSFLGPWGSRVSPQARVRRLGLMGTTLRKPPSDQLALL